MEYLDGSCNRIKLFIHVGAFEKNGLMQLFLDYIKILYTQA